MFIIYGILFIVVIISYREGRVERTKQRLRNAKIVLKTRGGFN